MLCRVFSLAPLLTLTLIEFGTAVHSIGRVQHSSKSAGSGTTDILTWVRLKEPALPAKAGIKVSA